MKIDELKNFLAEQINLVISLHSSFQEKREEIMPAANWQECKNQCYY